MICVYYVLVIHLLCVFIGNEVIVPRPAFHCVAFVSLVFHIIEYLLWLPLYYDGIRSLLLKLLLAFAGQFDIMHNLIRVFQLNPLNCVRFDLITFESFDRIFNESYYRFSE